MCGLYSMTSNREAIRAWAGVMAENDRTGNLSPVPGVFPGGFAAIARNGRQGRELAMARWGMPTPRVATPRFWLSRTLTLVANSVRFLR